MEEPALKITGPTAVSDKVKNLFNGMTSKESREYQLSEWVKGNSLHNPITDECVPDFSCCNPHSKMDKDLRIKFSNAHKMGDIKTTHAIMGMALAEITAGLNIRIIDENENNTIN